MIKLQFQLMNSHALLKGVTLLAIEPRRNERGLTAVFDRDLMTFMPVRSFAIFDVPPGTSRGGHSLSCDEFLWIAAGSCRVTFDNGMRKSSLMLENNERGVLVSAGIWLELSDFAPGTVVLGFAPMPFSETETFLTLRPDLISRRAGTRDPAG